MIRQWWHTWMRWHYVVRRDDKSYRCWACDRGWQPWHRSWAA